MAPYRSREQSSAAAPAPETGLVEELVRQFPDPYAFLRELIQNGIDAGATAIEVRIDLLANGTVTSQVCDDGSGMTREVIEGPLLTLFSSSKEDDTTKIGKYGVGFVSVFAVEPDEVEVLSWRSTEAEASSWSIRLFPDHSYELSAAEPRAGSGTRVTLVHRMDAARFARHVEQAGAALRRWCKHVRCPTEMVVLGLAGEDGPRRERIDRPLGVRSAASVPVRDGETAIVVGCPVDPPGEEACDSSQFAGFYNRGLTIHESTTERFEGLERLRFKIDSPELSHTLSRDDVRRDRALTRL